VGAAIGMGVNGLRPVAEVQFADYIYPACDQIFSELARLRFRSAGEFWAPVTIRTPVVRHPRRADALAEPEGIFTTSAASRWCCRRTRTTPRAC